MQPTNQIQQHINKFNKKSSKVSLANSDMQTIWSHQGTKSQRVMEPKGLLVSTLMIHTDPDDTQTTNKRFNSHNNDV